MNWIILYSVALLLVADDGYICHIVFDGVKFGMEESILSGSLQCLAEIITL